MTDLKNMSVDELRDQLMNHYDHPHTDAQIFDELARRLLKQEQQNRKFPIMRGAKVPWNIAELAYAKYSVQHGYDQSLERIAERGGFYTEEMDELLPNWKELVALAESALLACQAREAELREGIQTIEACLPHNDKLAHYARDLLSHYTGSKIMAVVEAAKEHVRLQKVWEERTKPDDDDEWHGGSPMEGLSEQLGESLVALEEAVRALEAK